MNEFAVLLDQGVPEPEAFLDPDAMLRRAHRRRTARRGSAAAAIACVTVVVAVATLAPATHPLVAPGAAGVPTVSALDHAIALPTDLVDGVGPAGSEQHQPTGLGVLAEHIDHRTIYLAAASDHGVCLMLRNANGSGATGCAAIADLLTTPLSLVLDWADGQPVYMAIVMPDGYTTLTVGSDTATAVFNVAYLPAITSTHGVISGPHVESHQVDLGPYPLPSAGAGSSRQPQAPPGPVASGSPGTDQRYPVNAHGLTYGFLADHPPRQSAGPDHRQRSGQHRSPRRGLLQARRHAR